MTLFIAIAAYMIGVIPAGKIVARLHGVKIESVGSGNVGATNVARSVGKKAGIITLLLDIAKGMAAVFLTKLIGATAELQALAGLCVVCGHCFSIPKILKGGKGVATALGVFFATAPYAAILAIAIFAIVFAATKIVSAGSLSAAFFILCLGFYNSGAAYGFSFVLISLLVIVKHAANIRRLLDGTEAKFK